MTNKKNLWQWPFNVTTIKSKLKYFCLFITTKLHLKNIFDVLK